MSSGCAAIAITVFINSIKSLLQGVSKITIVHDSTIPGEHIIACFPRQEY
jgi:hypothetical protein